MRNHIDAGMSVKRMYVVLLTAAVVAGCLLRLLDGGTAAFGSAVDVGETLGRVGAFFALAAIVPSAVVLLRRKPIASTATPTAVGMIVLAAVVYSSYRVLEFQQTFPPLTLPTAVGQSFSPPGCGFVVAFPSKPTMNSVIVPGFGEIPEAEISDDGALLRANCMSVSADRAIPYYSDRPALLQALKAYTDQNGINSVTYTHKTTDLSVRASARGTKQLSDRWFTFETVWYVLPQSVMTLSTASPSESYPTQAIARFLSSVERASQRDD